MLSDYTVYSNQLGPNPNTTLIAIKHARHNYLRQPSPSQLSEFQRLRSWVQQDDRPLILDSGCGKGMSTHCLADQFPAHRIIGIDKSAHRLSERKGASDDQNSRMYFCRGRLEDMWPLIHSQNWPITHHFILYPNPWPKSAHFMRRWHGHPIFPLLLKLSPYLEIRSNWLIYLQEFAIAANALTAFNCDPEVFTPLEAMSHFEGKYINAKQELYRLVVTSSHTGPQFQTDSGC